MEIIGLSFYFLQKIGYNNACIIITLYMEKCK